MGNIQFDESNHTYHIETDEGSRLAVAGVTSLLHNAGLACRFIKNERAMHFGTVGHETISLFLRDELDAYDQAFEPWMDGIRKFKSDCNPENIISSDEIIVYSEKYKYAGRPDFIGNATINSMGRGSQLYILDWKFWSAASEAVLDDAEIQLEAYARAAIESGIITTTPKKAVVHIMPNEYRIIPVNDPAAWTVMLSLLNINHWKERH